MPQGLGFLDFVEQLFPAQLELLVCAEFRDQVVVVGVEPLGQFLGVLRLAVLAAATAHGGATGHGEQGVQGRQAAFVPGAVEALGDHTECQGMGQYLVVPGEVADRQQVDAGVFLQLPVSSAQLATDATQRLLVEVALPVGFEGFFQFAVGTDAGKTKGVGYGHVELLL
ncbi:hypothetical protein D3C76_929050 [compost metagenome]